MQSKIVNFNNLAALAWAASEFGLAVAWAPVGFSTGLAELATYGLDHCPDSPLGITG